MKRERVGWLLLVVGVVGLLLTGCAALERVGIGQPSGILGTGVGNWQVNDTERAALNAVRPGLGDMLAQASKPEKRDPLDGVPAVVDPWVDASGHKVVWPLHRKRTKIIVDEMAAPNGSALVVDAPAVTNSGKGVDALLEEIGSLK